MQAALNELHNCAGSASGVTECQEVRTSENLMCAFEEVSIPGLSFWDLLKLVRGSCSSVDSEASDLGCLVGFKLPGSVTGSSTISEVLTAV